MHVIKNVKWRSRMMINNFLILFLFALSGCSRMDAEMHANERNKPVHTRSIKHLLSRQSDYESLINPLEEVEPQTDSEKQLVNNLDKLIQCVSAQFKKKDMNKLVITTKQSKRLNYLSIGGGMVAGGVFCIAFPPAALVLAGAAIAAPGICSGLVAGMVTDVINSTKSGGRNYSSTLEDILQEVKDRYTKDPQDGRVALTELLQFVRLRIQAIPSKKIPKEEGGTWFQCEIKNIIGHCLSNLDAMQNCTELKELRSKGEKTIYDIAMRFNISLHTIYNAVHI